MKAYAAKEVYMGYYWLVLVIDPYKIDFAVYSWKADNQIGMPIPDCVKTAMRETGERGKSTQIHHPRGIFVLKDDDDQMYFYNLDNLFEWHIKKGTRLLHTREGRLLTNTEDLKRLWVDNSLKPIPIDLENPKLYPKWHSDRLEAYLSDEHRDNLSKLEEAEKAQKTSLLIRITPTSPARVVGLLASIVTLIMFVYWLLGKL